jgi:hypothetical protein
MDKQQIIESYVMWKAQQQEALNGVSMAEAELDRLKELLAAEPNGLEDAEQAWKDSNA